MYDTDNYGQIINGPGTYEQLAFDLIERNHVVLNWTDERSTLLNILFSFAPTRVGAPGGTVDSAGVKLWVAVAGFGAFGYLLGYPVDPYDAERLGFHSLVTATKVAELISGAMTRLAKETASAE